VSRLRVPLFLRKGQAYVEIAIAVIAGMSLSIFMVHAVEAYPTH
jgi:hypothetical protein